MQEVKLDNVIDVVSESIPAQDTGLQVALAQEEEATHIECTTSSTQVPITGAYKVGDQVDLCSPLAASKTKSKSTRYRTSKKGAGGARGDGKGSALGKEDTGGDASETESKASP